MEDFLGTESLKNDPKTITCPKNYIVSATSALMKYKEKKLITKNEISLHC